jgi:hypothetical protein
MLVGSRRRSVSTTSPTAAARSSGAISSDDCRLKPSSLLRIAVGDRRPQQERVALDDRQQVVEVVRDAAGELADRLHLLRLAQALLQPLAVAHVAHDGLHQPVLAQP